VLNEEIAEETFVGSWQTGLSELVRGVKRGEWGLLRGWVGEEAATKHALVNY